MSSVSIAEYRKLFPIKKNKKRRSAKQVARQPSVGEVVLATHLRACKIGFEQEYKFHPDRKWRADFLITGKKILIEVEGGMCRREGMPIPRNILQLIDGANA
ncbi:hypothetical protein XB93_04610 [Acinetobacter baumannii]|nr:hypothetical protein [Acinetobacter baumannii]MDR8160323.1 hypothetical protein [Acinetobacter baumannii]MDR8162972.1 hypothetical protein [Acinetobacter baumannii]